VVKRAPKVGIHAQLAFSLAGLEIALPSAI
jgi:hypothetical protein